MRFLNVYLYVFLYVYHFYALTSEVRYDVGCLKSEITDIGELSWGY